MKKYQYSDNIVWEVVEGDILIMNANSFKTFLIEDRVGKYIWSKLKEPLSLKDIGALVKINFIDYEEPKFNEIVVFLNDLIKNQIITAVD